MATGAACRGSWLAPHLVIAAAMPRWQWCSSWREICARFSEATEV